ncbi:unnamed protein product [marine sediment metagenome]|uniref:Uncharacterized protein n=1 Tax=marine sediment metagenome TaxID=412755 RepID=X0S3L5_9ZZZZ
MTDNNNRNHKKSTKPTDNASHQYHSAGWAAVDTNSGLIHVRWWVPLVIISGALLIIGMSCSLTYAYKRFLSQNRGSFQTKTFDQGSEKTGSLQNFANMEEATDAYRNLYDQIDTFCKTVKSPKS